MKHAILSDVHANLAALRAVKADAEANGVDEFFCLGDIVGYGPKPRECLALIQEQGWQCVQGNHDYYVSNATDLSAVREEAASVVRWTRQQLSAAQRQWLRELPLQKRIGRRLMVHSSPDDPELWRYVRNGYDAVHAFHAQDAQIAFIGHTHCPEVYCLSQGTLSSTMEPNVVLDTRARYLVNVGSVGQPRDGDSRASYVILDDETGVLENRRVAYDISQVVDEIFHACLPEILSVRLQIAA